MSKVSTWSALLSLLFLVPAVAQQSVTADDLIRSLKASGTVPAQPVDIDAVRRDLRNVISVEPAGTTESKQRLAPPSSNSALASISELPNVSLEIYFDYNSSTIKSESMTKLITLGQALQDARLSASRFLIAGHTDGVGTREYNLKLSQDRAEAIRRFLMATFPIEPHRLAAIGFGKEQLRDAAHPDAAINRRVQVVNIGN